MDSGLHQELKCPTQTHTHTHTNLVDDIDPIFNLLSAQDWVQVVKPVFQVVVSVSEWDDYGHLLFGPAVRRSVFPPFCHIRVLSLYPLKGYLGAEFNEETPHCRTEQKRGSVRSHESFNSITLQQRMIKVRLLQYNHH